MKQILIIIILLNISNELYSQYRVKFYAAMDYNSFSMEDLKNLQNEILSDINTIGVDASITDSYPAYLGFQIGFQFPIKMYPTNEVSLGCFLEYTSTGGRVHYADYSGEIKADQLTAAYSVGSVLYVQATESDWFSLDFTVSPRIIFSTFKNEFMFKLGDEVQKEELEFSSTSIAIEAGFLPEAELGDFSIGLPVSYMLAFRSYLKYSENEEAYLVNRRNERLTINWSGLRCGLMVKYAIR